MISNSGAKVGHLHHVSAIPCRNQLPTKWWRLIQTCSTNMTGILRSGKRTKGRLNPNSTYRSRKIRTLILTAIARFPVGHWQQVLQQDSQYQKKDFSPLVPGFHCALSDMWGGGIAIFRLWRYGWAVLEPGEGGTFGLECKLPSARPQNLR